MEQITDEEIDRFLTEIKSKDRSKRALAVSKLGKATNSQDVIISALQQMIARERDDFVKQLAESSIQSLIDSKALQRLQDNNPTVRQAALAEIDGEQLKNTHILSTIENIATTDDDETKMKAQALLAKQQEELRQKQFRQESATTLSPSTKYPALRTIAGFYRILALIAGIFAVIGAISNLGESVILALAVLIMGAVATITLLAIAEGIYVLIDIEANTRQGR